MEGTRLTAVPNGNNVDELGNLQRYYLNPSKVGQDRRSETERVWVNFEGLAIRSLLKIQSDPLGNLVGFVGRRDEYAHASK